MSISPGDILLDPQKRALLRVHLVTGSPPDTETASAFDGRKYPAEGVELPDDVTLVGLDGGYTEMACNMHVDVDFGAIAQAVGLLVRYTGGDFPEIVSYQPFPAPIDLDPDDAQVDLSFTLGGAG